MSDENAKALAALRHAYTQGITYATCDDVEQETLSAALELAERVRAAPTGFVSHLDPHHTGGGFYCVTKDEPNSVHGKLAGQRVALFPMDTTPALDGEA